MDLAQRTSKFGDNWTGSNELRLPSTMHVTTQLQSKFQRTSVLRPCKHARRCQANREVGYLHLYIVFASNVSARSFSHAFRSSVVVCYITFICIFSRQRSFSDAIRIARHVSKLKKVGSTHFWGFKTAQRMSRTPVHLLNTGSRRGERLKFAIVKNGFVLSASAIGCLSETCGANRCRSERGLNSTVIRVFEKHLIADTFFCSKSTRFCTKTCQSPGAVLFWFETCNRYG